MFKRFHRKFQPPGHYFVKLVSVWRAQHVKPLAKKSRKGASGLKEQKLPKIVSVRWLHIAEN